jgi:DNA-binding MarR family transcriptional regulator
VSSIADFEEAAALREAVREFTRRSEETVRLHGLTLEQYQLLLLLRINPEGRATIGELHKALDRGQSAVTQLARRMENRGLITRQLSRRDARVRYLKLTRQGEERLTASVAALKEERSRLQALVKAIGG